MNKFVVTYGLEEKNTERQKGEMKKEKIRECEMSGCRVSNADFKERNRKISNGIKWLTRNEC